MNLQPGQSLIPSRKPVYVPFTEQDDSVLESARWLEEHHYGAAAIALRTTVQRHQLVTLEELKDKDNAPIFNALLVQQATQCRIWSNEHRSYWRAGGFGYCSSALHAGVFALEDAYKMTSHCDPDKEICYEILPTPDPRASLADMTGWKS